MYQQADDIDGTGDQLGPLVLGIKNYIGIDLVALPMALQSTAKCPERIVVAVVDEDARHSYRPPVSGAVFY
jgi:hypothetical protein